MDIQEVQESVKFIEKYKGDDESAHCAEDSLYLEILQHHAAKGCELSKEALKTQDIEFARWCA